MQRTEDLLAALRENIGGSPWHGSPVKTIVSGITEAQAHTSHGEANSIARLLAHLTSWIEIVDERLQGRRVDPSEARDFPPTDGVAWKTIVARFDSAAARLIDRVAAMPEDDWDTVVAGKKYTKAYMLRGLIDHNIYHSAQIALLKKLGGSS